MKESALALTNWLNDHIMGMNPREIIVISTAIRVIGDVEERKDRESKTVGAS